MSNQSIVAGLSTKGLLSGICLLSLGFVGSAQAQSCQNPVPVWADEFDGNTLDTSKWEVLIGDGCSYGICGWGNNELQSYQAENLTVAAGQLTITAKKQRVQSKNYTSGRIRTANMPSGGQWTHGRFEARIKLPNGAGMWPAFWMLPTDPDLAWPTSGEIDIVESTGQHDMFALGTIHYGEAWPNNQWSQGKILKQPDAWSDGFHEYAVQWSPGEIRWYVDDTLYSVKTAADMANPAHWTFDNYQYHLLLNLAVGGNMGGTVDDSQLPQTMEVDYVRVYDFAQPALSGAHIVAPNSSHTYSVVDEAGNNGSYSWSSPTGETSSGNQLTVNWGTQGGQVMVQGANSCGSYQVAMDVYVAPQMSIETLYDDFEQSRLLTYTSFSGSFNQSAANPAADAINSSATVGQYTRDGASQWDVIAASSGAIAGEAEFIAGQKAFYLDVYTQAAIGTEILVQLEDASVATPSNYPAGRHAKFVAHTQVQGQWQRLKFTLDELIDQNTAWADIDSVILLIDPDSFNSDTYYLDNFAVETADSSGPSPQPNTMSVASVSTATVGAGKGQKYGTASVAVVDDLGGSVVGAQVSVTFSGTWNETLSGITGADGQVTVQTTSAAGGAVTVNACVASLTGSLSHDAAQSNGLCQ